MNARAALLASLLATLPMSAAVSDEPAPVLDLSSETMRKVARGVAERQFQLAQVDEAKASKEKTQESGAIKFVPPEKPEKAKEVTPRLPDPQPQSKDFFSSIIQIALDEALGVESNPHAEATRRGELFHCRMKQELSTWPPDRVNCTP